MFCNSILKFKVSNQCSKDKHKSTTIHIKKYNNLYGTEKTLKIQNTKGSLSLLATNTCQDNKFSSKPISFSAAQKIE